MPIRFQWLSRIKTVEREYSVLRTAANRFIDVAQKDPTTLPRNIIFKDVELASNKLEATYLIRLFAEFEAGLRAYWRTQRITRPKMQDLIDGIASRRNVSTDCLSKTHIVRRLRNAHIHDGEGESEELTLAECRSALCISFGFLPIDW